MARIRPFRAFRYDPARVSPQDVVTQPYDKITPEMRQHYLKQSPYNLVRLILGEKHSADNEQNNVYTRAAQFLRDWIDQGILRAEASPCVYPYTQTFHVPGREAEKHVRRGFIALGALEPYENKVVFRHEQTLSGPKQDRLNLLRATRTHFGQIFMLYSDPSLRTEQELLERANTPIAEAVDEYGTEHRLFREADPEVIARLQKAMESRQLVIADGHHRYETALAYMREEREKAPHASGELPSDFVMMTFVNLDAPGMVVLPSHRVVHSLPHLDSHAAVQQLKEFFDVEERPAPPDTWASQWEHIRQQLQGGRRSFAAVFADRSAIFLLHLKRDLKLAAVLPEYLEQQRQLDVVVLHELALQRALGITPEAVREEKNLHYLRDAREALNSVAHGHAQAAFFLNQVAAQQVRDVALAGGVMPQKSTDFFPKLLSGFTLFKLNP